MDPNDLRNTLNARTQTRSIYGPRTRTPARREEHPTRPVRLDREWDGCRGRLPSEHRNDADRPRGAAHPMGFTDEVMEHKFPKDFKPINIEQYDGTTDPAVWIEDFLLHIHMANGDDLHAVKFLPLKLKGPARHWLTSLPENSIGSWEELEDAF
jgi:hypothetical protein